MASFGRYELLDVLGQGATGRVYRGCETGSDYYVAIKVLRSDLAENHTVITRFIQERSVLTSCDHPNLVRVIDLVVEGGAAALIMELAEGGSLRQLIDVHGTFSESRSVELAVGVLDALDYVHSRGVVHRDIKPENVLLTTDGHVKVADFGVAKIVADATPGYHTTSIIGTPNYLAPELAEGDVASPASDVYAAGILLYELLSGATPFEGGHPIAVMMRHSQQEPARILGVSSNVERTVMAMLDKDPNVRPSASQAAANLRQSRDPLTANRSSEVAALMPDSATLVSKAHASQVTERGAAAASALAGTLTRSEFPRNPLVGTTRERDSAVHETILSASRVPTPGPERDGRPRRRAWLSAAAGVVGILFVGSIVFVSTHVGTSGAKRSTGTVPITQTSVKVTPTTHPSPSGGTTSGGSGAHGHSSGDSTGTTTTTVRPPRKRHLGNGGTKVSSSPKVFGPYTLIDCHSFNVSLSCQGNSLTHSSDSVATVHPAGRTSNLRFDCSRNVSGVGYLDHVVGTGPWILDSYVSAHPGSFMPSCAASIL